jgi:hypothetical protein
MNKMIAFCGLSCTECPAFLATQKDDDREREKVSQQWSKWMGTEIKPEDINCDGCLSMGMRLFSHCNNCAIRRCGLERSVKNCAHCESYPCEKLDSFLDALGVPEAKKNLERIRKNP